MRITNFYDKKYLSSYNRANLVLNIDNEAFHIPIDLEYLIPLVRWLYNLGKYRLVDNHATRKKFYSFIPR